MITIETSLKEAISELTEQVQVNSTRITEVDECLKEATIHLYMEINNNTRLTARTINKCSNPYYE